MNSVDFPTVIAAVAGLITFLTGSLVTVLAFLGKFALATLDKRIDDAKARVEKLEDTSATHASLLASAKTQTEAENRRFDELSAQIVELRTELHNSFEQIHTLFRRRRTLK